MEVIMSVSLDLIKILIPLPQEIQGTVAFFEWFFYGLDGIGGWLIFFLFAFSSMVWLYYDSQKRNLPAIGWKMGVILLSLLLFPTILYRFTVTPVDYGIYGLLEAYTPNCPLDLIVQSFPGTQANSCDVIRNSLPPLTPYGEYIFYLGILGGVLAPVLAVGYYITFQGLVGCSRGHVYDASFPSCPECEAENRSSRGKEPINIDFPTTPPGLSNEEKPNLDGSETRTPIKPSKPKIKHAWLIDMGDGRKYEICKGVTRIGRIADSDIFLTDPSISRRHCKIREDNGYCLVSDDGSKSGTIYNGRRLREEKVLYDGDIITIGDTSLKFVSAA
jgi:ribosome-associated protein YbcJ (S4-like RNA binding protein)